MRRFAIVTALVMSHCSSSDGRVAGSFTSSASNGVSLTGGAGFWCVDRPFKMCGLHLYPEGADGDSVNFTVTGTTRPPPGTYAIVLELDPSGASLRANYLAGKKGAFQSYVAKSGTLTITESSAAGLVGTFALEAQGVDPVGNAYPVITMKGAFKAECQLHLRAAYTCD
jgi:hypothetical protein